MLPDRYQITVEWNGKTYPDLTAAVGDIVGSVEGALQEGAVACTRELYAALQRVARHLADEHSQPWNGQLVNETPYLQARTGAGIRGIVDSVKAAATADGAVGSISAPFPMSVHEKGATITAKNAKYLTIPLPAACDSRGVPLKMRARDWPNTFVARSKKGNLLIFQRQGRHVIPLYLLKSSVYLRPRLGMEKAVLEEMPNLETQLSARLMKQIDAI